MLSLPAVFILIFHNLLLFLFFVLLHVTIQAANQELRVGIDIIHSQVENVLSILRWRQPKTARSVCTTYHSQKKKHVRLILLSLNSFVSILKKLHSHKTQNWPFGKHFTCLCHQKNLPFRFFFPQIFCSLSELNLCAP